jgi:hypothetical protein
MSDERDAGASSPAASVHVETDMGSGVGEDSISDVELRATWQWYIDHCQIDFVATGNPLYAFKAFVKARQLGLTLPEWILEYLQRAMEQFWDSYLAFSSGHGPNIPAEALAAAFGLKKEVVRGKRSGGPTSWTEHELESHRFAMGAYVDMVIMEWAETIGNYKVKKTAAILEATRRYNKAHTTDVSESTMRRAWVDFHRILNRRRKDLRHELAELANRIFVAPDRSG